MDYRDFLKGYALEVYLKSRRELIKHLLATETEVQRALNSVADDIVEELERLERTGQWWRASELIDVYLQQQQDTTETLFSELMNKTIEVAVEAGRSVSREITIKALRRNKIDTKPIVRSFRRVYNEAVDVAEERQIKGLDVSDRIWRNTRKVHNAMGLIVKDAIHDGDHPIKVAQKLDKYVNEGAKTLVTQYPNMMERIGHMVPDDLGYESLRLARTEMMNAYGEATKRSIERIPGDKFLKWQTSNARQVTCDVCKENSERDIGHGKGVYREHELPTYPAHPNCMCQLLPVFENTDEFDERLKEWIKNPAAQPDIDEWYRKYYKPYEDEFDE